VTAWLQFGSRDSCHSRASIGTLVLCLLAAILLSGCIPFATPAMLESSSRADVTVAAQRDIEVAKTTRVDVLLALGEPDGRAADDSWFSYGSARTWEVGTVTFLLVSGFVTEVAGREINRMIIKFDAIGVVSNMDFQQSKCSGFMVANGCLDVKGKDLIAADEAKANGKGSALLSYAGAQFRHSSPDKCGFTLHSPSSSGPLVLTDRAIVMGKTSLSYSEVAEVLPVLRQELESWVALRGRDGICTFIFIPDSSTNAPRVHDLILKQLQAVSENPSEPTP
jgi:hypothetical protein